MECLIEIVDRRDHRLIRLAGRLTEAQVPELRHAGADKTRSIQLHLGELVSVDAPGLYMFDLVVTDEEKARSKPAQVTISATLENSAPVAVAEANPVQVRAGRPVTLDGS